MTNSSLNNSSVGQNDMLLIVENVGQKLQVQNSTPGAIVLEGVCAVFGQMNNNRRVYEKNEYLPHLTYLQEKISKNQLVGELDHPKNDFDVSLKNASHIIKGLTYDGGDKVNIKVQILENTPNGRIAKALVEGGVQLSISSRAAGQVNESGIVKLQRIFTYDLVGEPGFTEAVLKQSVAESLQNDFSMITESYNHLKQNSIVSTNNLVDLSESLNFADNYKVYKINKLENATGIPFQEASQKQKNSTTMSDFVTREQMDKYSGVLKQQFEGIKKELNSQKAVLESSQNTESHDSKLTSFVNYLAESLEGVINYTDYLSHKLNESVKYTEHVAETTNNAIEYSGYLGEKLNQSVGYQNYVAEKVNQSVNYSEYLKETLNNSIKYQNYLAENLDKNIQYTEYVAEGANRGIEFSEYLSENINLNREYSQYLSEKLGQNIGYSEYIAESLNGTGAAGSRNLLNGVSRMNESTSVDALISKVDQVITEVTDKSSKAVLESKYPFLTVMSEENKQKFFSLEANTKQAIVEAVNGAVWFNEGDLLSIMEAVVSHKDQNIPAYLKFMPTEHKATWEQMDESAKNRIHAKAQLYDVRTPYQAKTFWAEADMNRIQESIEIQKNNQKLQQLNESQSTEGMIPVNQVVEMTRGYSQSYLEMMKINAQNRR